MSIIGYNGASLSQYNLAFNGKKLFTSAFVAPETGTIESLFVKVHHDIVASKNYQVGVWALKPESEYIGDNLGHSASNYVISAHTDGWVEMPLASAVSITSGNSYWLAVECDDATMQVTIYYGTGSAYQTYSKNVTFPTWTDDLAGTTKISSAWQANIYANIISAAPSSLTASMIAYNRIDLAWADNSTSETGFKIERKTGLLGEYSQIDTVGAGVTSYSDTTVAPVTTYYYRVRSYNDYGNSAYSNEANDTTPPGAYPFVPVRPY